MLRDGVYRTRTSIQEACVDACRILGDRQVCRITSSQSLCLVDGGAQLGEGG